MHTYSRTPHSSSIILSHLSAYPSPLHLCLHSSYRFIPLWNNHGIISSRHSGIFPHPFQPYPHPLTLSSLHRSLSLYFNSFFFSCTKCVKNYAYGRWQSFSIIPGLSTFICQMLSANLVYSPSVDLWVSTQASGAQLFRSFYLYTSVHMYSGRGARWKCFR